MELIPGELYEFPSPTEWSSVEELLRVLNQCKILVASGKHRDVENYWKAEYERDKR
jgi:hypothetical protein